MNWLGDIIAARVRPADEILDLGCGIMPATNGRLPVQRHVGVDCYQPYLDRIGQPYVLARLPSAVDLFSSRSFDVVIMLDVVEHLDKSDALAAIAGAERIARREVIIFTPDGVCPQHSFDSWGLGVNEAQAHRCSFTFDELAAMGYQCGRHENVTEQVGKIVSVLGVKQCVYPRRARRPVVIVSSLAVHP